MSILKRLKRIAASESIAGALLTVSFAVTAAVLALPRGGAAAPAVAKPLAAIVPPSPLKISGTLSQTKFVQGSEGVVYLEVNVDPPAAPATSGGRKPVDLVVVLDHSGSMAVENRLPYAKAAINDLLGRLNDGDRFGLVTFESSSRIITPLSSVTPGFRSTQQAVVRNIQPAGSTNLSGGLELGESMLKESPSSRIKKIVLLSDGEANVGIIDQSGLGAIARRVSSSGSILSTIGMGLDFNETLMASLADHGMGNYSYLENLEGLGTILAKDLNDARAVYASASGLEVSLPSGASLIDTSGYPHEPSGSGVRISTGQVLAGVRKSIFLTISAPTANLGTADFGRIVFNYTADGKPNSATLDQRLAFEIVPSSERDKAIASIEQPLFKKGWAQNALGRMQRDFSAHMRAGNADAAMLVTEGYRAKAKEVEAASGVVILDDEVDRTLTQQSLTISDLKAAPAAQQATIGKRAAKSYHDSSISNQRN